MSRAIGGAMEFTNVTTGEMLVAEEWQMALGPGCFYVAQNPTLAFDGVQPSLEGAPNCYGEILEATDEPGVFTVRAFSKGCPQGEIGVFTVVEASRELTPDEFRNARKDGWP